MTKPFEMLEVKARVRSLLKAKAHSHAVMITVLLSILAHGLTAAPGIRWLSRAKPQPPH